MQIIINEETFREIYEKTYNKTLRFIIIKSKNLDDINDILQDTYLEFLKIIKKNPNIDIENIDNFIIGIANNIIKRHHYKQSRSKEKVITNEYENLENIPDVFSLEDNFLTKENVKEIWSFVKKKDVEIAKIFYLYFSEGLKISEIAKELKISESNVKNKIYRTLKELKNIYERGQKND